MRIFSSFHDYYDLPSLGEDPMIVYQRHTKEETIKPWPLEFDLIAPWGYPAHYRNFEVTPAVVGFCGKLFPLMSGVDKRDPLKHEEVYCYSYDTLDMFLKEVMSKQQYEKWNFEPQGKKAHRRWLKEKRFSWSTDRKRDVIAFFAQCNAPGPAALFDKAPIWVLRRQQLGFRHFRPSEGTLILNPCLKDYEFFRIAPPFTAHQELSMYLGSKAIPSKPMPMLPDEGPGSNAERHGFNAESFRTPKGSRPKRKRK